MRKSKFQNLFFIAKLKNVPYAFNIYSSVFIVFRMHENSLNFVHHFHIFLINKLKLKEMNHIFADLFSNFKSQSLIL